MKSVAVYSILISLGIAVSATLEVIPIETEPYGRFSAVFLCSSDKPLQSCHIKPPNSENWVSFSNNLFAKVRESHNGERYLYYGDGLVKGHCGVVILNPQHEDNGAWLCKVQAVGDPVSITEEVKIHVQEDVLSQHSNKVNAIDTRVKEALKGATLTVVPVDVEVEPQSGGSVVFICQLDKPVEICQIQAPNSEQWISVNNSDLREKAKHLMEEDRFLYYGDGFEKGDCGIVIPRPQASDSGVWKCNTKAVGESSFLSGQVEVAVTGTKLTLVPVEVKPEIDEAVVFVCQLNKPAENCMFQPPNSEEWVILTNSDTIDLQKSLLKGDRYFYYGDGFQNGDCGIVIPFPQQIDNGDWKCKTKAIGDSVYISKHVEVSVTEAKQISPWMIIFWILLVSILITVLSSLRNMTHGAIMSRCFSKLISNIKSMYAPTPTNEHEKIYNNSTCNIDISTVQSM